MKLVRALLLKLFLQLSIDPLESAEYGRPFFGYTSDDDFCHINACDALQKIREEMASATHTTHLAKDKTTDDSTEVQLGKLERRLRSVEQTGELSSKFTNSVIRQFVGISFDSVR